MKKDLWLAMALGGLLILGGCAAPQETVEPPALSQTEIVLPEGEEQTSTIITRQHETATVAEYQYQYANMSLELPEGWAWEPLEYNTETKRCGLAFWPEGVQEGRIELLCYQDIFGVCGTGLEEKTLTFENGLEGNMGTYDGRHIWDFIVFRDTPGSYVAQTNNVASWWSGERGEEVLSILGSATLGKDIIREHEALELTREMCTEDYAYQWARFNIITGQWGVEFKSWKYETLLEVFLDAQGSVTQELCVLPLAPK